MTQPLAPTTSSALTAAGSPQRYHQLDNLRALMMWLGIVIHVALNHMVTISEADIPWRDSQTSELADLLFVWIHSYRMPVFFILAGFFSALLVSKRGYSEALKQRGKRIGLPFLLFWPPLLISIGLAVSAYLNVISTGSLWVTPAQTGHTSAGPQLLTFHLWFIYYLLWFHLLSLPIYWLQNKSPWPQKIANKLANSFSRGWAFLYLSLPLALTASQFSDGIMNHDYALVPNVSETLYYGVYFLFGWIAFGQRDVILAHYSRCAWRYGIGGSLVFIISLTSFEVGKNSELPALQVNLINAYCYAACGWLWSFAAIGLFTRFATGRNRTLRYLADSSYWVYLIHFPLTIGIGALLYLVDLTVSQKMLVNTLATTAVCLISYQILVRHTWLGRLLNGDKRHHRNEMKLRAQTH